MKYIFSYIGPFVFLLFLAGMLIVFQSDGRTPKKIIPFVSAFLEEDAVTGDGKNLLGLNSGVSKNRATEKLLSLPPVPKLVALTFDDGPHPQYTKDILSILRERGVLATFFMHGSLVEKYPQVAHEVADAGHQVANHSYDPSYAQFTSMDMLGKNVNRTNTLIHDATGIWPTAFRPPGGWLHPEMEKAVNLPIVLWSVDPRDWQVRDRDAIASSATDGILPGDIIILHDIYRSTVESVPMIIDTLRGQGFTFVTIDELLQLDGSAEQKQNIYFFGDLSDM